MVRRLIGVMLILMCVFAPAVQAQDTTEAEAIVFFTTYIPNIQFSPLYVALAKGYFADAGFDVTLEYGDEPVGVDLIAAGERPFGLVSGEQVLSARANGRPVVFIYEWFQQYPVGIVTTAESGIATVEDLRGQRVGIPGRFGASYSGLLALLAANGMSESDIQLEEIGFNAPEVVCIGAISASVIYINNEPLQIEERIAQGDCGSVTGVNVIPVGESVDMVSNGLVTSEMMIAEEPEKVAAMTAAFDHALRDILRNPAEAYLLSADYIENLPLSADLRAALEAAAAERAAFLEENPEVSREEIAASNLALKSWLLEQFAGDELLQFDVLIASLPLWDAEQLGYSDLESWQNTQQTLLDMAFMSEAIDLEAAFTNAFLPETE